jgi:hypothetical protein
MTKRKRIKAGQSPAYPSDEKAKDAATAQRQAVLAGENARTHFTKITHSESIDILATWGVHNNFFVYAFPPAGFEIIEPEDVLNLSTYEGWILQYVPQSDKFNLLVKASRDGYDYFKAERDAIKRA